jgi:hypothetical protein
MANKPRNQTERFDRILDGLEEYNENAPGDELLDDARREGGDPSQATAHVKQLLRNTLKSYRQRDLIKAKEGFKRDAAALQTRQVQLPKTLVARRALLGAILAKSPELQVTFANRDFTTLTDEDVEKHLRKLSILGVLDDVKLSEGDE